MAKIAKVFTGLLGGGEKTPAPAPPPPPPEPAPMPVPDDENAAKARRRAAQKARSRSGRSSTQLTTESTLGSMGGGTNLGG